MFFFRIQKDACMTTNKKELCEINHVDLPNLEHTYGLTQDQLHTMRRQALNAAAAQRCRQKRDDIVLSLQARVTAAKDREKDLNRIDRKLKIREIGLMTELESLTTCVLQKNGRNCTDYGVSFKNGGPKILE